MKCPKCNYENTDQSKFCMKCGQKLGAPTNAPPPAVPLSNDIVQKPINEVPPTPGLSLLEKLQSSYEQESGKNDQTKPRDPTNGSETMPKVDRITSPEFVNQPGFSQSQPASSTNTPVNQGPWDSRLSANDTPRKSPKSTSTDDARNMTRHLNLLDQNIVPATGEISVRTYQCSYYKSWLIGLEADGYISITNKRIIYQALGNTFAGKSVIQSEVPITDVSGISSYKGAYFSIWHLVAAIIASFFLSSVLTAIGAYIGYRGNTDTLNAIAWLVAVFAGAITFLLPFGSIWRPLLAFSSSSAVALAGGGAQVASIANMLNPLNALLYGNNRAQSSGVLELMVAAVILLYAIYCAIKYARRPTFSIAINSKGGSSTPINISKASGLGVIDFSASGNLGVQPAADSEIMLQELGAVIMDIQTLGDMGIEKWKSV